MDAPVARDVSALPVNFARLAQEVAELKRVRSASTEGTSLAEVGFRRAWARLSAGHAADDVAYAEVAFAAVHATLGPVDATALDQAGLSQPERRTIYERAAHRSLGAVPAPISTALHALADGVPWPDQCPPFVDSLARQPRAGAVSQDAPRLVLSPEETHAEHCWSTAVLGAVIAHARGEPPGPVALLGLIHHAHNAFLADGGFAAELLLGDKLASVVDVLADRALAELPGTLAAQCRRVLADKDTAQTPLGAAFNAADVIDRVLQQKHYATLASFSLSDAVDERGLVHEGPLQAFQMRVLIDLDLVD